MSRCQSIFAILLLLVIFIGCERRSEVSIRGSETAVIGGSNADIREFPFLVNIWQNSPKEDFVDHLCGGSLIAKKWILTAAHCMLEDATETTVKTVNPAELNIIFGSTLRSGDGGRMVKARSVIVHPDFSWPHHDVALIELAEEVTDIKPIQLNATDIGATSTSLMATVAGWGLIDAAGKVDGSTLQKISLPLISRDECQADNFPIKHGWTISSDIICVRTSQNQKASCPGDSGGPLFLENSQGFVQVGIVSWGSACANNRFKFGTNAEGYADVSDALPWIQRTIGN